MQYWKCLLLFISLTLGVACHWFPGIDLAPSPGAFIGVQALTSSQGKSWNPVITWADTQWGVAWVEFTHNTNDLFFSTFQPEETLQLELNAVPLTVSGTANQPDILWSGTAFILTWKEFRNNTHNIYYAMFTQPGDISPVPLISRSDSNATEPALVLAGDKLAFAWVDDRDGSEEIYFTTTNFAGTKLLAETRITFTDGNSFKSHPRLAWCGTHYAVVWQQSAGEITTVFFALINTQGNVMTSKQISSVGNNAGLPVLAWNGSSFGLAWEENIAGNREVLFTLLTQAGAFTGGLVNVSQRPGPSIQPALTWNQTGFGLCWLEERSALAENSEIKFVLLTDALGNGPEAWSLSQTAIAARVDRLYTPDVCWNGEDYGIVFSKEQQENNYSLSQIFFAY